MYMSTGGNCKHVHEQGAGLAGADRGYRQSRFTGYGNEGLWQGVVRLPLPLRVSQYKHWAPGMRLASEFVQAEPRWLGQRWARLPSG